MKHAARPVVSLGVVLACVFGTMALGTALKAPCAGADWGDVRQYRFLCYSDIVPLMATEQLFEQGGRLPFLDACEIRQGQNCDEYPVVTMYFIRIAAWISGDGYAAFFTVNTLMLLACAMVVAVCLYVMNGSRALYFALAPTLLIYATMNWDLLAVAFATLGLLYYFRRREVASGAALGVGAAAKLYPGMLAVPLIAQHLRDRRPDRAIGLAWSAAGAWLLVNLPFAIVAPGAWWTFFRFNEQRLADFDSLWHIGCRHLQGVADCISTRTVNVLALSTFAILFIGLWWLKARREPDFPRWTLGFPMLVLFLLTSKVYSPQFSLWLLPWFALALPRLRTFVAFQVAEVLVFVTRFWFFGELAGVSGVSQGVFEATVLLRAAVLVWCLVTWVRTEAEALEIEIRPTEDRRRAPVKARPAEAEPA